MPSLTIRHVTTYRYRRAVAFGEHRIMLHPRNSHDQRVVQVDLKIGPKPRSLRFVQDAFGNHVGIAWFSRRSTELSFESIVRLEHSPREMALDLEDAGPSPSAIASLSCATSPLISNAISTIRWTRLGDGLGDSCSQAGRSASSFSRGCHKASITASFTGGEKRRASSCR